MSKVWVELLVNWGPMLLLILVWVLFMLYFIRRNKPNNPYMVELKRHNEALEKILASHESRLQNLERGGNG